MSFQTQIDQAIVDLHEGPGVFSLMRLREHMKVGDNPRSPEAKQISNRLHTLMKDGILRTEGTYKRNRHYRLVRNQEKAFLSRVRASVSLRVVPNGRPRGLAGAAPIKGLARLAELDGLRSSLQDLTAKITRIETMVADLHAGLFGEPIRTAQSSEEKANA
jgi:hypothetical protein